MLSGLVVIFANDSLLVWSILGLLKEETFLIEDTAFTIYGTADIKSRESYCNNKLSEILI